MKTVRETVRRRNSHSTKHLISLVGPALIAFFKISTNWPKTPPTGPQHADASRLQRLFSGRALQPSLHKRRSLTKR